MTRFARCQNRPVESSVDKGGAPVASVSNEVGSPIFMVAARGMDGNVVLKKPMQRLIYA